MAKYEANIVVIGAGSAGLVRVAFQVRQFYVQPKLLIT